jgi:hypothetical protein
MNAAQKTLFNEFEISSVRNGIDDYSEKMSQARQSGAAYRSGKEAVERRNMAARFGDDLMMPYQDTYRNQIPAILLAMGDTEALRKVISKKMTLVENQQRLTRYLFEAMTKGTPWLLAKWADFKKEMSDDEVEEYEDWLKTFAPDLNIS